jgi:hypothetical protein
MEEGGLAGEGVISKISGERGISTSSTCMLQGFWSTDCVVWTLCVEILTGCTECTEISFTGKVEDSNNILTG